MTRLTLIALTFPFLTACGSTEITPLPIPERLLEVCPRGPDNTLGQALKSYGNEVICWRERSDALFEYNEQIKRSYEDR